MRIVYGYIEKRKNILVVKRERVMVFILLTLFLFNSINTCSG